MKIGIVGANSQVGTELAVLFADHADVTVRPIVRNQLGTHFLRRLEIGCEVADVTDDTDAQEVLADLDTIVVAAFAWQYSQEGFEARGARKANKAIVSNTVEYAPADARIVYLSSQAAFGNDIGAPQYTDWSLYTREKRNAEWVLEQTSKETNKRGYAFRLGFVHGPNQSRTKELRDRLAADRHVYLVADPDKPSNVIHTVTLRDAVLQCGEEQVPPGTYSLTNEPQWTWEEVCDHYSPDNVILHYRPPSNSASILTKVLQKGWNVIEDRQRTLRMATVYVPDWINQWLFHKYLQQQRGGELRSLRDRKSLDRPAFKFDPMPGSNVPGIPPTDSRLTDLVAIRKYFEEERPATQM